MFLQYIIQENFDKYDQDLKRKGKKTFLQK